jgi:quercetin dioxygenase-like cupin family protein
MKKRSIMVGMMVLAGCFLVTGMAFSETVVIETVKGKGPIIIPKDDVKMAAIDWIGGEKPENKCEGWTYGTFYTTADNSLKVNNIVIEPNGKIGTHEGGSVYVCVVVEGEGVLTMVDTNNKVTSKFNWKPGDVIVFRPPGLHRWDNGDKRTVMIGIETVP